MYTNSLVHTAVVLERCGVNWEFWPVNGDFHIERAVNGVLARFLYDEEATDILLIDSDESWDFMAVMRLLARKEEVVGCAYRMKNNWEKYTCQIQVKDGVPQGYILPDNTALLRAERLPGGFLRIKKSALEKFVAAHRDEWFYYDINGNGEQAKGADPTSSLPTRMAREGISVRRLEKIEPSLEDVFVALVEGKNAEKAKWRNGEMVKKNP